MPEQISMEQALQKLRDYVATCSSQNEAARKLGISPAFLSDTLNGARPVSDTISRQLGYAREVVFKEIDNAAQ